MMGFLRVAKKRLLRETTCCYSLDDILKGFDVGVFQLREIGLDVVVEIDLTVTVSLKEIKMMESYRPLPP